MMKIKMEFDAPLYFELLFNEKVKHLFDACISGDLDKIKTLIKENSRILRENGFCFFKACEVGNFDVVNYIIRENLVDLKTYGIYALISACAGGHLPIVKLLCKIGVPEDLENESRSLIMANSAMLGHLHILKFLLSQGFRADNAAICNAALAGNTEIIRFLIQMGGDPSKDDVLGHYACKTGDVEILGILVEFGFDIHPDFLNVAVTNHQFEVVKYLIENNYCHATENENSAFFTSIKTNQKNVLEFLFATTERKSVALMKELLQFSKLVKSFGYQEPTECIHYLENLLDEVDGFPVDIPLSKECPVCLEGSEIVLPCRHVICRSCYKMLVKRQCPSCRYDIDRNLVRRQVPN